MRCVEMTTRNELKKREKDATEKKFNNRLVFFQWTSNILFFLLLVHLFMLQVFDIGGYKARGESIRNSHNFKMRGDILDRNGLKLATDKTTYEIYAHPKDYLKKRPVEVLAKLLLPYMDMSEAELVKKLSQNQNTVTLRKNVDKETADAVRKLDLREISVGVLNKRFYPQGSIASHIIGYYSNLSEKAIGIEYIADNKLKNFSNNTDFERKRNGAIIFGLRTDLNSVLNNPRGEDLTLTIDTAIQHICEKELEKVIKEKNAQRGAIIVMNPKNGEILAYASYPSFDPNNFSDYPQSYMKNWTLTDVYPPGSTFKIITVASAMELGKINENSRVLDTGKMTIGKHTITNYDYGKHPNPGYISLEYLFEHSSNVGSANVAFMMGKDEYYNKLRDFGFGQKTGIDLTAESSGLLPKPIFWDKSRHATMGYGYGASVTGIQMLAAISAIANDGVWITPHVIKYSEEEKVNKVFSHRVMSELNAVKLTKILAKSIANGKTPLNMDNYTVAAKTGTSKKNRENAVGYSSDVYTSAIGFFPATAPKIAMYVVVDAPRSGSDWGNTIASPVFREVAQEIGRILNIPADKESGKNGKEN